MSDWDSNTVKVQLRLAAQQLGQLQERKDSQAKITRRDIATLLQQGNVGLARAKAQNLIQEELSGDLLEILEMHVGVIIEHLTELEQRSPPRPVVVEAASSIIFAAHQTEFKELGNVHDILVRRLGPDFTRSAITNRDNYVSLRIVKSLSAPPPSAAKLDDYLLNIASNYGVQWTPELQPQEVLNSLSEILDPTSSSAVDLPRLRRLCSQGIPDDLPWLRPRIWKLLFGILPVLKSSWQSEITKQRQGYYDLVYRLLTPLSDLPPPADPLAPQDASILDVSKQLSRVPPNLFSHLQDEPDNSAVSPLDGIALEGDKIACASNLDSRLRLLQGADSNDSLPNATPEIRLESDDDTIEAQGMSSANKLLPSRRGAVPTTLLISQIFPASGAHKKHVSTLIRLLYIHSCLNPANHSPHIPSLLVLLYSALVQEVEIQELAHVEADTFWLFEAVVGEFSELEDEEGGNLWMKRLGERLAWADPDLSANLLAKGLDPGLPHYSYRWLAPLLTQTLPLSSVLKVWDALFSRPMRERDSNPKLDYLLDICSSMLTRARGPLFRLGKSGRRSPGLWGEENLAIPPPSPLRAWELSDAFLEGMSLLQLYPVEAAGGIERILQTAADLAQRRIEEAKAQKSEGLSLGARLKVTMWKGFTNKVSSPDLSPEDDDDSDEYDDSHDDGNDTETPQSNASPGLTSRFASTVWKGITNQSSMEVPPSPLPPLSPSPRQSTLLPPSPSSVRTASSESVHEEPRTNHAPHVTSSIWGYAEKLKDSDTAAALAKVGSNWRAKAMDVWGSRSVPTSPPKNPEISVQTHAGSSRSESFDTWSLPRQEDARRGSLPSINRDNVYSPPSRPAYFRPPRDSMLPQPRKSPISFSPISPDISPQSEYGSPNKTENIKASLASLTGMRTPSPAAKSGPRPLLLGSSSVVKGTHSTPTMQSTRSTPAPPGQWSHIPMNRGHSTNRDSRSSVSSLSPSDALNPHSKSWSRSDCESDTVSRIVRLNRKSISPLAPNFRGGRGRPDSSSSGAMSDKDNGLPRRGVSEGPSVADTKRNGWGQVDMPDSPVTVASPPVPRTPLSYPSHEDDMVHVSNAEHQRGSVVLSESNVSPLYASSQTKKMIRKKTPPPSHLEVDDTSDSSIAQMISRSPRLRSKRYSTKPANLRITANARSGSGIVMDQKAASPNSLAPEWPEDHDSAITPRAGNFEFGGSKSVSPVSPRSPRRVRKISTDGYEGGRVRKVSADSFEPRLRKISTDGAEVRLRKISAESHVVRSRKVSTDGKEARRETESAAEEGDDEGYDELLSAYESEEGSKYSSN